MKDTLSHTSQEMITPGELKKLHPSGELGAKIDSQRKTVSDILHKRDERLLVVTGPCSIHNPDEAIEIAENLKELQEKYPELYLVMRAYGEKPRTTLGWKGYINDPHLDGSFDIETGLIEYRKLLVEISNLGIPIAAEFLDPMLYHYYSDLITWGAIGARSSENPGHRTMAANIGLPIGFKNTTEGSVQVAADGVITAQDDRHIFPDVSDSGKITMQQAPGNPDGHIILRGSDSGTNYSQEDVKKAQEILKKDGIQTGIMIDFSHQNSRKNHENQVGVSKDVGKQLIAGNKDIVGIMMESHIHGGGQKHTPGIDNPQNIKRGLSITDKCVSQETEESIFKNLDTAVRIRNNRNQ